MRQRLTELYHGTLDLGMRVIDQDSLVRRAMKKVLPPLTLAAVFLAGRYSNQSEATPASLPPPQAPYHLPVFPATPTDRQESPYRPHPMIINPQYRQGIQGDIQLQNERITPLNLEGKLGDPGEIV